MKVLGELTHPVRMDTISVLLDFISSHTRDCGYGEQRVGEIESAVREALTNIVEFVCTEGQEVTVQVGDDKGRRFVIDIMDSQKPYNMLLEADPFLSGEGPAAKRPSVRLIKKIGDVEYKRFEGKNHLVVTVYPVSMTAGADAPAV